MKGFITEDNNNLAQGGGVAWVPSRTGMVITRRKWLSVEALQALSHKGLSRVAVAVKVAASSKKAGDPGVLFANHGRKARGKGEIFGFALHRQRCDHLTDQLPAHTELAADESSRQGERKMAKHDPRLANVTDIARMFELSVNTVRSRLRAAKVGPVAKEGNSPLYRMSQVGPALFGGGEL